MADNACLPEAGMALLNATSEPGPMALGTHHSSLRIDRLTGMIGAEISGISLANDICSRDVEAIEASLVEHKVLFFRDQAVTAEQYVSFARIFGTVVSDRAESAGRPARSPILTIESRGVRPSAANEWHSDETYEVEPPLGGMLRCRIAPQVGGDTLWANMAAAYEGLDDATRGHISSLTAVHDWEGARDNLRMRGVDEDTIREVSAMFPPAEHPVVRTHPVSGEKILYVNPTYTVRIKGMKDSESGTLLQRLYRQANCPDYQVRFRWRTDSIAFWDNRSTQHYVARDFFPQHRLMERITLAGDRPF